MKKEEDFPPNFSFLSSSSSPPPRTDSAERSPGKSNEKRTHQTFINIKTAHQIVHLPRHVRHQEHRSKTRHQTEHHPQQKVFLVKCQANKREEKTTS